MRPLPARSPPISTTESFASCPHCGFEFVGTGPVSNQPRAECPSCGRELKRAPEHFRASGVAPIQRYFSDLWQILTRPSQFFRRMPTRGGVGVPLAFALIAHWLGEFGAFLWHSWIGERTAPYFQELFKFAGDVTDIDSPGRSSRVMELKDHFIHWFWGSGSVLIDPFATLFSILFTSFFVYLGAKLLVTPGKNGAPSEITFESALRIICFGMSPAILAALPVFGSFISVFCVAIVTIIGAREVYRVGNMRATAIALFPKLLFFGIILAGLALLFLVFLKLVSLVF